MKVERKFTIMQILTKTVNDTVKVSLEYGEITGSHYNQEHPTEIFDTEDDAINYAYKQCKYSRWIIVPIVSFVE